MGVDQDLFEMSPEPEIRFEKLGGQIPVILIDNFYRRADDIREMALALPYEPPSYPYPGKLAVVPRPNRSLSEVARKVLKLVNGQYLRRVPPIAKNGKTIAAFRELYTDFAVVDVHPDELTPGQRRPHVDPVPVFGLVYLNREERGGTLFFRRKTAVDEAPGGGYLTASNEAFELIGRIEPAYNRMAIYPGFVPHCGEIAGDWIRGEERFKNPRLTQRFVFRP